MPASRPTAALRWWLWAGLDSDRKPWPAFVGSGLLFGVATLVRAAGIGVGLAVAVGVWFALRDAPARVRLPRVAAVAFTGLIVVAPWSVWVSQQAGRFTFVTVSGPPTMVHGLTYGVDPKRAPLDLPGEVRDVQLEIREASENVENMMTLRQVGALIWRQEREHPTAVARLYLSKISRSWYATSSQTREHFTATLQVIYLLLIVWGALHAWRRGPRERKLVVLLLCMAGYFWAVTTVTLSIVRYMVPAILLLFALVPFGLSLRGRPSGREGETGPVTEP